MVDSLQFDPAPRAGEPLVSRRVPDYFLVRVVSYLAYDYTLFNFTSAVIYVAEMLFQSFELHACLARYCAPIHTLFQASTSSEGLLTLSPYTHPLLSYRQLYLRTHDSMKRLCRFPTCSLNDNANFLSLSYISES